MFINSFRSFLSYVSEKNGHKLSVSNIHLKFIVNLVKCCLTLKHITGKEWPFIGHSITYQFFVLLLGPEKQIYLQGVRICPHKWTIIFFGIKSSFHFLAFSDLSDSKSDALKNGTRSKISFSLCKSDKKNMDIMHANFHFKWLWYHLDWVVHCDLVPWIFNFKFRFKQEIMCWPSIGRLGCFGLAIHICGCCHYKK